MKRDDIYYNALLARDPRFDGKFFVGVKTTGIYCRPICPAKPKRKNVVFFQSYFEAEKSGYRPCLRCRPESAPRSPAWVGKTAVVQRAVKVLNSQDALRFNEDRFAAKFGVTARHLRRLFTDEVGKTPKQLAFENRLNLARNLLVETTLSISEIAFSSGFNSIRRFNDAFKDRFKKAPREIRRLRVSTQNEGLRIRLSYRPPFDFEGLLRSYNNHRVGELEVVSQDRMSRIFSLNGKIGEVIVRNDPLTSNLIVTLDLPDTSMVYEVIARVRAMFDLDSDPILVANALEIDSLFRKLSRQYPGVRLPSGWDPFEIAVATILGQLVSVERGRTLVADLMRISGTAVKFRDRCVHLFPTPKQIVRADLSGLKTTAARRQALVDFARAVDQKEISLEATQDVNDFVTSVRKIKGIGPWTAEYMALKALRHTDSFPKTDLVLARALEKYPDKTLDRISPWRGYVAALVWRTT